MLVDDIKIYFMMFFLFCMVGWVWESIYMSIIEKRIQSRGFLFGPYIPIYGIAGIIMNFTLGRIHGELWSINTIVIYFLGIVCATSLEFITSIFAEKYLHRKLWDYSMYRFNYKGKICLAASLFWGVAAVSFVQILNPKIVDVFLKLDERTRLIIVIAYASIMIIDIIVSFSLRSPLQSVIVGVKDKIINNAKM